MRDGNAVETDVPEHLRPGLLRDGSLQLSEVCDDGNRADTDACTNACALARCGDGVVQEGVEACDDGNDSNADACVGGCLAAFAGDGYVQDGVEARDDGNGVDGDARTNAVRSLAAAMVSFKKARRLVMTATRHSSMVA